MWVRPCVNIYSLKTFTHQIGAPLFSRKQLDCYVFFYVPPFRGKWLGAWGQNESFIKWLIFTGCQLFSAKC